MSISDSENELIAVVLEKNEIARAFQDLRDRIERVILEKAVNSRAEGCYWVPVEDLLRALK